MNSSSHKRYQVVLWPSADRTGLALFLDFATLPEAEAELRARQSVGEYRAGVLMEWNKLRQEWELVDRYPPVTAA